MEGVSACVGIVAGLLFGWLKDRDKLMYEKRFCDLQAQNTVQAAQISSNTTAIADCKIKHDDCEKRADTLEELARKAHERADAAERKADTTADRVAKIEDKASSSGESATNLTIVGVHP